MKKIGIFINKILVFSLLGLFILAMTGCVDSKNVLVSEIKVTANEEMKALEMQKLTIEVLPNNATNKEVTITSSDSTVVEVLDNNFVSALKEGVTKITVEAKDGSGVSYTFKISVRKNDQPIKPETEISVGIICNSEIKSGKSMELNARVTAKGNVAIDQSVTWKIVKGAEYAELSADGLFTAKDVDGDKVVEVRATSNADDKYYGSKIITIISKPTLTDEMLEPFRHEKVSFEGYVNIDLYTVGLFEKLYRSHVLSVKTSMDGTNWYAEYLDGNSDTTMSLYFKKHDGLACQVGLSFTNEEIYEPMLDNSGKRVSWTDSGLYNSLGNLTVDDFKFNEDTWRYEYIGEDKKFMQRVTASANPYDFVPQSLGLVIEEGEVMGIYADSAPDYSQFEGYKAIQKLVVVIDNGASVKVPSITKYPHLDFHDDLNKAIENMHNLKSYELDFRQLTNNNLLQGKKYTETGFTETITDTLCHFQQYGVSYDGRGNEVKTYVKGSDYGYKKIRDDLYNSYYANDKDGFDATRAYAKDFSNAKPSFNFVAEIFDSYYVDKKAGTTTYYSYELMKTVASTFYYGVGNDINLYGIFAQKGYISADSSFTPYVVVKDGYIVESCFYFYLGSLFGVVNITYSKFNEAQTPEGVTVEFEKREVPSSWNELTIQVRDDESSSTEEDVETNALQYFKEFFKNEDIDVPFFGNPLGDTYGFGLTTYHKPSYSQNTKKSLLLYYDVPLNIDYTINDSIRKIEEYLISLGFVNNGNGEYSKDGLYVAPKDSQLDLVIYVWKD